ncbi:MAG: glycosyltransferase [Bacteroidales bacterium]
MKRVYIAVINDLVSDQRVHRMCRYLLSENLEVRCFGRALPGSGKVDIALPGVAPGWDPLRFRVERMRMLVKKGPLFYAFFNVRLFFQLLVLPRPHLLVANDLDTLLPLYLIKRIKSVPLVYDSHELFTEVPELQGRSRVRWIWKRLERALVPRVDAGVTVSASIARIYQGMYGTKFHVVRNVPERRPVLKDPEWLLQTTGRRVLIYQGALNEGRGLELLIDTMSLLPGVVLLVVGRGDIEKALERRVLESGLGDAVFFLGRVPPGKLHRLTCSADVGVSLEEDRGRSYRYALPNKVFDYIQARVPVLCSDLPEMRRIVEIYGTGMVCGQRSPESLAAALRFMLEERRNGRWMDALEQAADTLCWENEVSGIQEILSSLGVLQNDQNNSTRFPL